MAANIRPRKWSTIERPHEWRDDAACIGMDAAIWYQEPGEPANPEALAVCGGCPVRLECLDYAEQTNEQDGVWGGLTISQRQKNRRITHKRTA